MMSLGQVAEATTAHLGTQAAPRQGQSRLPQTRFFMVPVALLAKASQVSPRPLPSSSLPCATALHQVSRRTRRRVQHLLQKANLRGHLHQLIWFWRTTTAETDDLVSSSKVKATTRTSPVSTRDTASSKKRTPSWSVTAGSWKRLCKGRRGSSKLNGIVLRKTPANNGSLQQLSKASVAVPVISNKKSFVSASNKFTKQ